MKSMLRKLLRNRKGTAEIIGSVMFIVILLFFFTNVYLWHDAATKEMNDLYVEKINSPIVASVDYDFQNSQYVMNVTNKGGVDATLSRLWTVEKSVLNGPDGTHYPADDLYNVVVASGQNYSIPLTHHLFEHKTVVFKVITTVGNSASCSYSFP
jgi:hypothetical protein